MPTNIITGTRIHARAAVIFTAVFQLKKCSRSFAATSAYMVVNDFKWQINYVRAIKYLLRCSQRLGKVNAIMYAKYQNRRLFT